MARDGMFRITILLNSFSVKFACIFESSFNLFVTTREVKKMEQSGAGGMLPVANADVNAAENSRIYCLPLPTERFYSQ